VGAKLRAEHDEHPWSRDWDTAPAGTLQLYGELASSFAANSCQPVPVPSYSPFIQLQLGWLEHHAAGKLIDIIGDQVAILRDPEDVPQQSHCAACARDGHTRESYPGLPKYTCPWVGKRPQRVASERMILWIAGTPQGEFLCAREYAAVINSGTWRKAMGITEYGYLSVSAVTKILAKLRAEGSIVQVRKAVKYRKGHRWCVAQPAQHIVPFEPFGAGVKRDEVVRLVEKITGKWEDAPWRLPPVPDPRLRQASA